ncbi:MAG: hypothetical protein ACXADW_20510 [Candidatus Hodarchaeales archaeon]
MKKRKITPMKGTIQPPRQPDRRPLPANMRKTPRGTTEPDKVQLSKLKFRETPRGTTPIEPSRRPLPLNMRKTPRGTTEPHKIPSPFPNNVRSRLTSIRPTSTQLRSKRGTLSTIHNEKI